MAGYLVLKVKSSTKQLFIAVIIMVMAIKNSVQYWGTFIILNVLKASVMEWPMVKAVTKTSSFFQSVHK